MSSSSSMPSEVDVAYTLPSILENWPWGRRISPHYADIKNESLSWMEGFRPFGPVEQERYRRCDFGLDLIARVAAWSNNSNSSLGIPRILLGLTRYALVQLWPTKFPSTFG
jgi:hypothetical protein